jgi:hypothetical protein
LPEVPENTILKRFKKKPTDDDNPEAPAEQRGGQG